MRDTLLAADLQPRSELIVPEHPVLRAKYPAIDAHNHLPVDHPRMQGADIAQLVREMDLLNDAGIVNLSGGIGGQAAAQPRWAGLRLPGRFVTFCNGLDGDRQPRLDGGRRAAAPGSGGGGGSKIFKDLGLTVRDTDGQTVMPDDPRLSDIWDTAGSWSVPVLIHSADPVRSSARWIASTSA